MNNRRLVQLFLLVLAIFLSFRVVPMAGEWRASLATDIERLSDRREQLEQLLESRDEWRGRLEKLTSGELTVVAGSLPGGRPEVASARLQSLLRGYADEAGVEVSSLSLPEFEVVGDWRLLRQVVTMRGTEAAVLGFLERLESGNMLLRVVGFEMREDRPNLHGSVTVVGFAPLADEPKESTNE
ncbi:MAG: hypothetical protein KDI54_16605 [Gammaproteobacteria bacterium]|nr:hypothetical protein [Gammaproteobacteria bacterium]